MLNKFNLTTALAIATIGVGSFSSAAQAAKFDFSYTLVSGDILTGRLDGDVQEDGDTVMVNSVSGAKLNGVRGPRLPFVTSFVGLILEQDAPATVSFSGTFLDIYAARSNGRDGFIFVSLDAFELYKYSGGFSFGEAVQDYNAANWSLTPVPEPLTMLGAGAAVAFGASFKRRLAKK
jgi:hypothetical protein